MLRQVQLARIYWPTDGQGPVDAKEGLACQNLLAKGGTGPVDAKAGLACQNLLAN